MGKERIFIALRPSAATRGDLVKIQRQLNISGKRVVPENLHLTLAFLGDCTPERKRCVLDRVTTITGTAFDLQLSAFGYFKRHRIFYIVPEKVPQALLSLHKQLSIALSPCHYRTPGTFKPHVSLFRGVNLPPRCKPLDRALQWSVRAVSVERSCLNKEGARYTTLKTQALPVVK